MEDPLYVGLRQKRVSGKDYDDFVDEFMQAVVTRYGQNTLIQFEDFGNHNAFRYLDKYRSTYCTFNDDIQGTASVAVAGLLASTRVTNKKRVADNTFCFLGAGEAALGIANLTTSAMVEEGLTEEEARSRIWMMDIDGLLAKGRPEGKLDGHKAHYAKDHPVCKSLVDLVKEIKPTVLIGISSFKLGFCSNTFTHKCVYNRSLSCCWCIHTRSPSSHGFFQRKTNYLCFE